MAHSLDSATRQALLARVRFYRDLGLTEFYRRPVDPALAAQLAVEPDEPEYAPQTLHLPEFQEDLFIRIDRLPTLHSPRLAPGNALNFIEFRLASEPESVVQLNSSTNLTDWQDWRLITNTMGDDIVLWADPDDLAGRRLSRKAGKQADEVEGEHVASISL